MGDPQSTVSRDGATVAAHDIARLAGVGRAAVSNWRRRFPDFPKPVGGTSASPLYSLADVEAWLARHGRQFQLMPGDRVWQQIRGTVEDLQLTQLMGHIGAFLLFLRRDRRGWTALARRGDDAISRDLSAAIASRVPELPGGLVEKIPPAWTAILRSVADAPDGHTKLFDYLCERYFEVHSRRFTITPAAVAALMVELADTSDGDVLDPACGVGTLLLHAQTLGATVLLGQETDPDAARLAAARLLLHDAKATIATGDSLRADAFAGRQVDAVVCSPPMRERSWGHEELVGDSRWEYGLPPRGEPELAWVQHCLAHVKPGRPVVVTMPASAANRRPGRRIRSNLLRAGALRAVISLPPMGPGAVTLDLWILTRPDPGQEAPSHVLMVNASADLSVAVPAWRSFLADPAGSGDATSRPVRIIDLLDEEVDISPVRHLATATQAESEKFEPARASLRAELERLARAVPELAVPAGRPQLAMTTVGELARAGVLAIHQAPLKMTTDSGDTPALKANDVLHGRPPSGWSTRTPGCVVLQPGDVVTPAVPKDPAVRVITEGGALLGPGLLLFRVDPDRLDPYFLAGHLRVAQHAARASMLATRSDVRRTVIPRLPIEQQRAYGEAFRQLITFEEQSNQVRERAMHLVWLGLAGLADGSLHPRDSKRPRR